MKRLALLVLLAYAALLFALTWPWLHLCFFNIDGFVKLLTFKADADELLGPYKSSVFWAFLGVVLLCQAGLLFTPVRLTTGRPATRRALYLPIITSGFLIGALGAGLTWSVSEVLKWETSAGWTAWAVIGLGVAIWLFWGLVFLRTSRSAEPKAAVLSQCWRLFQGGAIAFLVAVPCHIWVRHRNECCAGFLTFIGLTFGLAVMLLSFGPGIYFLFAERARRLRPRTPQAPPPSDVAR